MKEYQKTYEDVFTSERSLKFCDIKNIKIDLPVDLVAYTKQFKEFISSSYEDLWMMTVKITWLYGKFIYKKRKRRKLHGNGHLADRAFSIYVRQYVGYDPRYITRSPFFTRFHSYMKDFFPEFGENNPFMNPELYKIPYTNVKHDLLAVVFKMPERLDLLKIIDEKGLTYNQSLDYIINYVCNKNEELGGNYYQFMMVESTPPYVRFNKKNAK